MNDCRGVVFGIGALASWISQNRGTQDVFRQIVSLTHALVDHVIQAHGGAFPADIHANLDEHRYDASILADRPMPRGTHTRIDQNLRNGIFSGLRLFTLIGFMHCLNEVDGVIIGNVLQRIGYALDQIILFDNGHAQTGSSH